MSTCLAYYEATSNGIQGLSVVFSDMILSIPYSWS